MYRKKALTKVQVAIIIVIVIVAAAMGVAYWTWPPRGPVTPKEELKIGFLAPLTGIAASDAKEMVDAARLAADIINEEGGILGRKLSIVVFDTELNPDKAAAGAEKLITEDKVFALMGTWSSGVALAVADVAAKYKRIFIVTVAASPSITEGLVGKNYEKYKYVFRCGHNSAYDAEIGAIKAIEFFNATKYAFIAEDALWAHDLFDRLKPLAEKIGARCVFEAWPPRGALDFSTEITKLKATDAQLLISGIPGASNVIFVKQCREMKLEIPHVQLDSAISHSFAEATGEACDYLISYVIGSAYARHTPLTAKFGERFMKKYGYPTIGQLSLGTYDGLLSLKYAIEKVGTLDNVDAIVKAMEEIEFTGAMGKIKYDKYHQNIFAPGYCTGAFIQWFHNATIQPTIWPPEAATAELRRAPWWK